MRFLKNFKEFKTHFEKLTETQSDFLAGHNHELQISENDNAAEVRQILWYYKENCDRLPNTTLTIFSFYDKRPLGNLWDLVTWGLDENNSGQWSDFLTKGLYDPRLLLWIFAFGDYSSL